MFENVIEMCGGEVVPELNNKRQAVNVILRIEEYHDAQLYLENKDKSKKWKFLKGDLLVDSILRGEFVLDEKYVVKGFDEVVMKKKKP